MIKNLNQLKRALRPGIRLQGAGTGCPRAGTAGVFLYGGRGLNTRPVNNNRESAMIRRSPSVFMEELIWIEPISRQS